MQTDENKIDGSEKKGPAIQDLEKKEVEIYVADKEILEKEIQCKDCKLPIEPESKKCHHCGSWQGKYSRIFKGMINFITIAMLGIAVSQAVIGYSQYKESKNKRIEAEGVLKQAEKVLEDATSESEKIRKKAELILSDAKNSVIVANSLSSEAKDKSDKVLSMVREELKTVIEKAKESRKGFDKASNDVKADLEESNERISFAEANFLKKFSKLKSDLEELKHDSTVELAILKDRNELVAIADKAVVHGDRASLEKLDKIIQDENELQDKLMAAASEKLRVYS